jgi:hypothetical protein
MGLPAIQQLVYQPRNKTLKVLFGHKYCGILSIYVSFKKTNNIEFSEWVCQARVDPTKLFFLRIFFFSIKLGHFTINKCFSACNKNASLAAKNGEILC